MPKDKPSPTHGSNPGHRLWVAEAVPAGPQGCAGGCWPADSGAAALSLLWQSHLLLSQPPPGTLDC